MATYGNIGFTTSVFHSIVVGDSTFETALYYPYYHVEIPAIKPGIVSLFDSVTSIPMRIIPDVLLNTKNYEGQHIYPTAFWKFDYSNQHVEKRSPIPQTNGYIQGTVKVEGAVYANVPVRIHYRPTGLKIFETFSDENGIYRFDGLCPNIPEYLIVSILDNYQVQYNAQVLDRVSAVKSP